ncbi:MAG: DUF423 domain-containing protein [Saprospiraceae bacterium]
MENRKLMTLVFISGALAVLLGAFGAHGLKPYLDESGMSNYQTANRYHFIHTILSLIYLIWAPSAKLVSRAVSECLIGIILFSGSLYILSLRSHIQGIPSWLGAITPLGGLFFVIAWLEGAIYSLKKLKN